MADNMQNDNSVEDTVDSPVEESTQTVDETVETEETVEATKNVDDNEGDDTKETDVTKEDEASDKESQEKKLFHKKKKDKKDEQIEELNDRLKRQMAEFENFRKRAEKEKTQMFDMGARSIIEKMLPVVDNFERGLAAVPEENREDGFVQGMDKIYKQLMTTLEGIGVKPIEAVGQEFNPDFHNAVMHIEDEEAGENVVVEEFQKGYMYRESVVRHSMVKVAN